MCLRIDLDADVSEVGASYVRPATDGDEHDIGLELMESPLWAPYSQDKGRKLRTSPTFLPSRPPS